MSMLLPGENARKPGGSWFTLVVGEDLGDKNHRPAGKQSEVAP